MAPEVSWRKKLWIIGLALLFLELQFLFAIVVSDMID